MKMYYAKINDFKGEAVLNLKYTATAKHSVFLAQEFIDNCPPAQSFTISYVFIQASDVANMLNKGV
jgi:hypothetical protein